LQESLKLKKQAENETHEATREEEAEAEGKEEGVT